MRGLGYYCRLMGVFVKYSLMSALEYRANFIAGMTVEMGWMIIKLLYVAIIYKAGTSIGILTPDHILLFVGTYIFMTGIFMLYFGNFNALPGMIQQGELDLYIVKPVSLQFLVTMRRLEFAYMLPNLVAGTVMIVTGWRLAGLPADPFFVAGFLFFLVWLPVELQSLSAALSSGLLDRFSGRHCGYRQCDVGLQQHAVHDLREVGEADRHICAADFRDNEFSGTVPYGRTGLRSLPLGGRGSGLVLYNLPAAMEDGTEKVQQRKLLRKRQEAYRQGV